MGTTSSATNSSLPAFQFRNRVGKLKRMLGQPPDKACTAGHKTSLCGAARDKKAAETLTYYPVSSSKSSIMLNLTVLNTLRSKGIRYGMPHAHSLSIIDAFFGTQTSLVFQENKIEKESKGFLSNRIADRRGDHFDHRGDCHPEPALVAGANTVRLLG